MDVATAAYLKWKAENVRISNIKEGVDDVSLDFAMFATGVKGIVNTATTAWKLFFSRKITQTAVKNAPKIEKVALSLDRPKMIRHHLFNRFLQQTGTSQKYREFFKKHKINVDDYCVELPRTPHINRIHQKQNDWTNRWKNWIDEHPNATTKEVYQFAGKLMDEYGISHVPIIKYRK